MMRDDSKNEGINGKRNDSGFFEKMSELGYVWTKHCLSLNCGKGDELMSNVLECKGYEILRPDNALYKSSFGSVGQNDGLLGPNGAVSHIDQIANGLLTPNAEDIDK
jgi:hypothetical protein